MKNHPNFQALPYEAIQADDIVSIVIALRNEIPHLLEEIGPLSAEEPIFRVDIKSGGLKKDSTHYIHYSLSLSSAKPKRVAEEVRQQNEKFLQGIKKEHLILPDTRDNESTILYILTILLAHINYGWNMVYLPEKEFKMFEFKHIKISMAAFLQADELLAGKRIKECHVLDISPQFMGFDLAMFYNAVFRALKKQNYGFEYRSPDCAVIIDCIRECKSLLEDISAGKKRKTKLNEEMRGLNSILKSLKVSVEDPLDEDAVCAELTQRLPKDRINLYHDVYGKYPDKYPLRAKDY